MEPTNWVPEHSDALREHLAKGLSFSQIAKAINSRFNTTYSRTVMPLPYHGQKDYTIPPRELEDDPVYRRFPKDWEEYHTRYVSPDEFLNAMKPPR